MTRLRRRSRRGFLTAAGAAGTVALAGCTAEQTGEGDDGIDDDGDDHEADTSDDDGEETTLTIATYESFVDAPSSSPGPWLAETFEEEYGVEIEWATPENGLNHYIERRNAGASIDADLFVGLNVDDLVRLDEATDDGSEEAAESGLFKPGAIDDVEGVSDVREELRFDPRDRVVPYATNYISLVYDGTTTTAPGTFAGLLEEDHRGALITQNPSGSTTGRAFFLHTVHRFGTDDYEASGDGESSEEGFDDYLDYWAALQENDVRVQGSWGDAYAAWSGGEAPMVVSYSTDQVFAAAEGADLEEHQVRFLDEQAYANPEGAAVFADTDRGDLAREFISFLLSPRVQGEIAELNVQFPATTTAELGAEYDELAKEPPEPVTFTYEELQGSVDGWIDAWERQFAEQ